MQSMKAQGLQDYYNDYYTLIPDFPNGGLFVRP
jgi:hypothetical protein